MTITRLQERLIISRAIIELIKVSSAYRGEGCPFGANASEILVAYSVLLGTLEGHPMNASKVAQAAGLPRTTTKRHLTALEKVGLVVRLDSNYMVPPELLNGQFLSDMTATLAGIIQKAATDLAEMDTKAIAGQEIGAK